MPARAIEPVEELPSLYIAGDQSEESIVFYVELAAEGVKKFEAAVSEVRGITRFENYGMPRRRWREAISDLENDSRLCAARVPGAFARWVLEEGYLCAVAAGRPVPRAFQQVRHTLAPAVVPARHPVLDLVSDDAVAAAGPTERVLAQVLGLPGVAAWRPDEDWLERAEAKLQEIVYSPLNVDERMKEQRVRECLQAQAAEALANGWRARLERRSSTRVT